MKSIGTASRSIKEFLLGNRSKYGLKWNVKHTVQGRYLSTCRKSLPELRRSRSMARHLRLLSKTLGTVKGVTFSLQHSRRSQNWCCKGVKDVGQKLLNGISIFQTPVIISFPQRDDPCHFHASRASLTTGISKLHSRVSATALIAAI